MGIFSFAGNLLAGRQGSKLGKKQMELGQGMIDEAQALSAAYERPELAINRMTTPESINQMVELTKQRQYSEMPGYSQAQNQIGQSSAQTLRALSEMGSGAETLGAVGDIYSQNLAANRDLAVSNTMFKDQAEKDYLNALGLLGQQENQNFLFNTEAGMKEFDWNKAQPYANAQNKAAMLEAMGRSGQWEGLKTKMGSWAETFSGAGSELDSMFSGVTDAALQKLTGLVGGGG
jgi:hypothetical protein